MSQYYDSKNHRLVFINKRANSTFWESHWDQFNIEKSIKSVFQNRVVKIYTKKYLPEGSCILEGGCGLAQNVWTLQNVGYDAYGVDYAKETIKKVNDAVPELKVSQGDVRKLKFEDSFFDGYWSLGVIEHFYGGFDGISSEMRRVIKPGGYLFLTFPCVSKFREKKIRTGKYKEWKESQELLLNFYQFALSSAKVEFEFLIRGFDLVEKKSIAGFKGFKDEIEIKAVKTVMQKIFDSKKDACKAFKWGADKVLAPYFGHMQLLIFRNLK